MPQGLIRIVMPLLMVLVFLIYVLVELPQTRTPNDTPPVSEAAA